jgi:hypothetical protein
MGERARTRIAAQFSKTRSIARLWDTIERAIVSATRNTLPFDNPAPDAYARSPARGETDRGTCSRSDVMAAPRAGGM